MYVLYQQHLSVMNKANTWKCFSSLGCDALYSDKFLRYIFEELSINVCYKYEVDGLRNVGTFLSFIRRQIPEKGISTTADF
jgi:hypothetical protein